MVDFSGYGFSNEELEHLMLEASKIVAGFLESSLDQRQHSL